MRLPKIQEDECPQKNTYFNSIAAKTLKKYKTDKLTFDWQAAQVQLITRLPDQEDVLQPLIQLQNECKNLQIPHFYSYFFVSRLIYSLQQNISEGDIFRKPNASQLATRRSQMINKTKSQIQQIKEKKSKWNKIIQLIQLRQNLVSKINNQVANAKLETVYNYLDDIRFVNFQLVKKIGEWSETQKTNSDVQPFFLYQGKNYLIKMINDNTNVINLLNSKAVKFLSPPNPFYLSRDGNKASMSQGQQSQIDFCMQILAKQKAQQLKMILHPPKFVVEAKNQANQLKKLKNQLQQERIQKIRLTYKASASSFTSSQGSLRNSMYVSHDKLKQKNAQNFDKLKSSKKYIAPSIQNQKLSKTERPETEHKNKFEKMIQDKQVAVVQQMKNSKIRIKKSLSKDKLNKDNKGTNKYISKIQSLRKSVQGNKNSNLNMIKLDSIVPQNENNQGKSQNLMRLSQMSNKTNQIPKTVAQIKAPKPKIKLLIEKQTFVQDIVKVFLPPNNLQMYKSMNVRKTSGSFFKPDSSKLDDKKQLSKVQEQNVDIKPITQNNRNLSASSLTNFKDKKKQKDSKVKLTYLGKNSKSKSRSVSKSHSSVRDLSLSQSPNKRFSIQKLKNKDETQSSLNESNLRAVNSKLRQLTIMSIYGKKMKSNNSINNPYHTVNEKPQATQQKQKYQQQQKQKQRLKQKQKLRLKQIQNQKLKQKLNQRLRLKQIQNQKLKQKLKQKQTQKEKQKEKEKQKLNQRLRLKQAQMQRLKQKLKQKQTQKEKEKEKEKEKLQVQSKRERQKQKIDEELRAVKNRLNDISKRNIYERKTSTKGFSTKKQRKESVQIKNLEQQKQAIENKNKKQEQMLNSKKVQKQKLLQNLGKKDKRIQELVNMLKKESESKSANKKQQLIQEQTLKEERQKKRKEVQELQEKIKNENRLIKQRMEEQQVKFIKLKQKEFQMKEEQMTKKYEQNMNQMKQDFIKKNKELQMKIMMEEKIRKQHQIKILQEQRQMQELQMQMEQKRLREQLLEQILRDQRQKQIEEQKSTKENQQLKKQRIKRQILEKEEMERKLLQNYEDDNRKLVEMFEMMKKKNESAEKQNQIKMFELKKIEEQTKQEQENLRRLEAELIEARDRIEQEQKESKLNEKQEKNQEEFEDMQQLKLRVKEQILKQMMKKRRIEQDEQKIEEEERAKKLAEIQLQIRNQLQKQQEQMDKIEAEEREKFEQMKRKIEEQHRKKMQQLDRDLQQKQKEKQVSNEKVKEQSSQEYKISKQDYQNQLNKAIQVQKLERQKKQKQQKEIEIVKEKEELKVEEYKSEKIKENQIQNTNKVEQTKVKQEKSNTQQMKEPKKEITDMKQSKEESLKKADTPQINLVEQEKKVQKKVQEIKGEKKTEQKVEENKKQTTQTVKQSNDEILNKYQNLQQYLSKCKQIFLDDKAAPEFVNNFYSQFPVEVKEMLPYSAAQLTKHMVNVQKKVDIFECNNGHSVGWMDLDKYILIGQISCVENIVRKYGQIQIEMSYIFNKTNPYQKQFLAKQVKIFDKVGFIFQKKLKQQNMYSIKLIIKVPSEIIGKNYKAPNNQLQIRSKMTIDLMNKSDKMVQNKKYSFEYMLSQTLKNCLGANEQLQLKQDKSQQARLIQNKLHHKLFNDLIFKSFEIDDKILKVEVNLGLKYIQTHDFPAYVVKGFQYYNLNSGINDKIFVASLSQNLSMVAFPYDSACEQFSLDILLNMKTNKLQKQRQLLICLPVWKKNEELKLTKPGPKQFTYSYTSQSNLSYGSIISTNTLKQQYKFIEAPFVFGIFETNDKGLLLRSLLGQVVHSKDLINQKR